MSLVNPATVSNSPSEIERQLEMANSQLAMYARDLKRMVAAERQKAQELADANARLQILDRLKTDFLSFISHKLRTPLNAMAALDIFDPDGDPQERAELIELIRSGYERLQDFTKKRLEYFNWLSIDQPQTSQNLDLAEVVRMAAEQITSLRAPEVDYLVTVSGPACLARGEKAHLVEVARILLDNALKFSVKEKFIRVDLAVAGEKATMTVTDRGRGFPAELAAELFRPFTVADVAHLTQGTGLNLALAAAIVRAYGGQMEAKSEGMGMGATFILELPRADQIAVEADTSGRRDR